MRVCELHEPYIQQGCAYGRLGKTHRELRKDFAASRYVSLTFSVFRPRVTLYFASPRTASRCIVPRIYHSPQTPSTLVTRDAIYERVLRAVTNTRFFRASLQFECFWRMKTFFEVRIWNIRKISSQNQLELFCRPSRFANANKYAELGHTLTRGL